MQSPSKSTHCVAVLIAISGLCASLPAMAASPEASVSDTVQDYTHALPLSVSGKQGVVGFRLPQEVYLSARSAGLDDLRVFDASGARVPFAVHVPPQQERIQRSALPVKVFPVRSNRQHAQSGDGFDLDIRTAPDGTLLSVKTRSGKKATPGEADTASLAGLVLDVRQAGQTDAAPLPRIEALRFTLPPGRTTYSAQVWLEVSDNLKQWDRIGTAELSWLVNSETQTLANDRLEFEARSFRYARITWRNGEPIQFGAITAESVDQDGAAPVLEKLLLQPSAGKEAQDLVYQAGIAIPVEKAGLQFTEANIVLPAALGSYREIPGRQIGQPTTWRFEPLTRTTFYQITQDGQRRHSGDVAIPLTHQAQWVLRPDAPTTGKPVLSLSWQAATLVFLASGSGPYTLAFGRDKVKPAALSLTQVAPGFSVQELGKLEQASAGVLRVQAGAGPKEESSALAAATSAQTRMLILWGVLLLGVAVLGVMGWKLFRQMK